MLLHWTSLASCICIPMNIKKLQKCIVGFSHSYRLCFPHSWLHHVAKALFTEGQQLYKLLFCEQHHFHALIPFPNHCQKHGCRTHYLYQHQNLMVGKVWKWKLDYLILFSMWPSANQGPIHFGLSSMLVSVALMHFSGGIHIQIWTKNITLVLWYELYLPL